MKIKLFIAMIALVAISFTLPSHAPAPAAADWPTCNLIAYWSVFTDAETGQWHCFPTYCDNPVEMGQTWCVAHWGQPNPPSPCFSNE